MKQILQYTRNNDSEGNKRRLTNGVGDKSEIIELVEKAAGGDSQAFGNLYRLHVSKIYQYIVYQVRNSMLAEDITSDVFTRALEHIETCKGKGTTFTAWLYRIAHNRVIDFFRSNRRNVALDETPASSMEDIKQDPFKHVERQELLKIIGGLPENQRQVILLKFIIGLDNREISQVINKSEGAIRILQMRALASLRKRLDI